MENNRKLIEEVQKDVRTLAIGLGRDPALDQAWGRINGLCDALEESEEERERLAEEGRRLLSKLEASRAAGQLHHRRLLVSEAKREGLKGEIHNYIEAEKKNAGPDIGKPDQPVEDACRAARIAAFSSVLYLLEGENG